MLTNCISYIFSQDNFDCVNYIDDLVGAERENRAWEAFFRLGKIISDIGMQEAEDKASAPSRVMIFLGLEVNTILMTLKIPHEKMCEIRTVLRQWLSKSVASKREIQQLVGLLNFAAGCIKPGRIYFSRILNVLRGCDRGCVYISSDLRKDIEWWWNCAERFNGISYIMNPSWEVPRQTVQTDVCLTGCGALTDSEFFHTRISCSSIKGIY